MSPSSTEVTVNVKVIDKSMPVFDKQFYSVSVPEDIEINSHLSVSIKAESPLSRKLIYSISSGNTLEQFAIDFNTGKAQSNDFCVHLVIASIICSVFLSASPRGVGLVHSRLGCGHDCASRTFSDL